MTGGNGPRFPEGVGDYGAPRQDYPTYPVDWGRQAWAGRPGPGPADSETVLEAALGVATGDSPLRGFGNWRDFEAREYWGQKRQRLATGQKRQRSSSPDPIGRDVPCAKQARGVSPAAPAPEAEPAPAPAAAPPLQSQSSRGGDGPQAGVDTEPWEARVAEEGTDHGHLIPGELEWWELKDPGYEYWHADSQPVSRWFEKRPWDMRQAQQELAEREKETPEEQARRRARIHAEVFGGEGSQGGAAAAAATQPDISSSAPTTGPCTPHKPPQDTKPRWRSPRTKSPRTGALALSLQKSPRKEWQEETLGRDRETPYTGTAAGPALHRSLLKKCTTCERHPFGNPTQCTSCEWLVCAPPYPCCVPVREHDELLNPAWNESRCAG